MKKQYLSLLLAGALLSSPLIVCAEEASHFYIGASASSFSFDINGGGTTYGSSSGASFDLGYDFNNILAIQATYAAPGSFEATGSASAESISYIASLFLRANMRFERSSIFFLAGGSSLGESNTTYDGTGPAYGVGIDFYGTKNTALTLKYVNYLSTETTTTKYKVKLDGPSLGFTYYFDTPRFSRRY